MLANCRRHYCCRPAHRPACLVATISINIFCPDTCTPASRCKPHSFADQTTDYCPKIVSHCYWYAALRFFDLSLNKTDKGLRSPVALPKSCSLLSCADMSAATAANVTDCSCSLRMTGGTEMSPGLGYPVRVQATVAAAHCNADTAAAPSSSSCCFMAENPTREGVGALGLFITGLPEGILLDEGDAMQLAAAAATGGCKGERSKSASDSKTVSIGLPWPPDSFWVGLLGSGAADHIYFEAKLIRTNRESNTNLRWK